MTFVLFLQEFPKLTELWISLGLEQLWCLVFGREMTEAVEVVAENVGLELKLIAGIAVEEEVVGEETADSAGMVGEITAGSALVEDKRGLEAVPEADKTHAGLVETLTGGLATETAASDGVVIAGVDETC